MSSPRAPVGAGGAAEPMSATDRIKWAVGGWAIGFVASVLMGVVVFIVVGLDGGQVDLEVELPMGWLFLAQIPLWLGLLGAPALAQREGLDWRSQLGWSIRPRDIPIGVGIGLALQFVLVFLYIPIFWIFGDIDAADVERPARELTQLVNNPFDVILLMVMVVVMAPLAEEVFFRGLLQGALQERFGPWVGLGVASLVFAATHLQLIQFPGLLLVGVAHGLMYLVTRRIGSAVCSHVAFNSITVILLLT